MAEKVYVIQRKLVGHLGETMSQIVDIYTTEELAGKHAREIEISMGEILKLGQIVMPTPEGPQLIGMTPGAILNELGIKNIVHQILAIEPKGSILIRPNAGLVLAKG